MHQQKRGPHTQGPGITGFRSGLQKPLNIALSYSNKREAPICINNVPGSVIAGIKMKQGPGINKREAPYASTKERPPYRRARHEASQVFGLVCKPNH